MSLELNRGSVALDRPAWISIVKGRRFRAVLDEGRAGEQVGVLLGGVAKHDVERGQVLAKLDSITSHTKFEAEIYLLTKEEQPIAMEPGLPFEIREGGRRVGVGIVIDIAE